MTNASERRSLDEVKKLLQSLEDATATTGTGAGLARSDGPRASLVASIADPTLQPPTVATLVPKTVPPPLHLDLALPSTPPALQPVSTTVRQTNGSGRWHVTAVVLVLAAVATALLLYANLTAARVGKDETGSGQPVVEMPILAAAGAVAPASSPRSTAGTTAAEPLAPKPAEVALSPAPASAKESVMPPAAQPEPQPAQAVVSAAHTATLAATKPPVAAETPPTIVLAGAPGEAKPQAPSPAAAPVPAAAAAKAPPAPVTRRLRLAPSLSAAAGRTQPFPIAVEGFPSGASGLAVVISGLPPGASLSAGTARSGDLWTVSLADVDGLQLTLPRDSSGRHQLFIELRSPTAELLASASTALTVAAAPAAPPAEMADPARIDDAETARLLSEGKSRLNSGHVAPARLLFRRAADAGSGEAARLLGDSYDPAKLYALGVRGASGDIDKAIYWYERADELGDPHAKARMLALGGR